MAGVFMPRPITDLVILGVGQSAQSWPAVMAERPAYRPEVWTINAGALAFRHDVVFDMHTEEYVYSRVDGLLDRILARRKLYETHDKPVVMPQALDKYPTSQTYPLKLVMDTLRTDYFINGMCYMLAMAHLCDVHRLVMMGADFFAEKPDGRQFMEDGRACVEYWLGRLAEKGTQVLVTDKSQVLGANVRGNRMIYGYHQPIEQIPDFTAEVVDAHQ